mgnify:CR=1 FL=1
MRFRDNATVSGIKPAALILLVSASLLMTSCATPVPLHRFIDDLRSELVKTKEITRLTVTQVANGQGNRLLKEEQDAQCSSDPILMLLGGDLVFKLKTTVGGELGTMLTPVPAPTIKITGSGEHLLDWKVSPVSLGNLANVVFEGDIKIVENIRAIEGSGKELQTDETIMIKKVLLTDAWKLRKDILTVVKTLIDNWEKPPTCR